MSYIKLRILVKPGTRRIVSDHHANLIAIKGRHCLSLSLHGSLKDSAA